MPIISPHVRHNYLAIAVAVVASMLIMAVWYTLFLDVWLKGIGRDRVWMAGNGVSQVLQCATALLAAGLLVVLATAWATATFPAIVGTWAETLTVS